MIQLSMSLRLRLLCLVLLPMVVLAIILGVWRYYDIQKNTAVLFEKSLLSAALAISKDIDMVEQYVPPMTLLLVNAATGGNIGYHVAHGTGAYITGYAYPPSVIPNTIKEQSISNTQYVFYRGTYRQSPVQALKLHSENAVSGKGGLVVTVWRQDSERGTFAENILLSAVVFMIVLLSALILIVWFGVYVSLRPLNSLQDAISLRSANDLSRIRRPVPVEISGIVKTLNDLFKAVEQNVESHQKFISNASHQLRNPIAGILSLAESVKNAKCDKDKNARIDELLQASQETSRMTNQLLSLERLKHSHSDKNKETFDLNADVQKICTEFAPTILANNIDFQFHAHSAPMLVHADRLFVSEAIKNLLDNALKHSGDSVTKITCTTEVENGYTLITVSDDGVGINVSDFSVTEKTGETKLKTKGQEDIAFGDYMDTYHGTGLGLSIAYNVAHKNNGYMMLGATTQGTCIKFFIKQH